MLALRVQLRSGETLCNAKVRSKLLSERLETTLIVVSQVGPGDCLSRPRESLRPGSPARGMGKGIFPIVASDASWSELIAVPTCDRFLRTLRS